MLKIWKYELELASQQVLSLPPGADILHVGEQNGKLCMWVLLDARSTVVTDRRIGIVGTGQEIATDAKREHIGTVQIAGYVWHVFELFS